MHAENEREGNTPLKFQIYGASAATIRRGVGSIMNVDIGKKAVRTNETGVVHIESELLAGSGACAGCGTSGGGGEGEAICLIIIAVLMALFTIVWAAVMIVFSIVTLGGFIKRRYRTLATVETENLEFLGKLSVYATMNRAVLNHPIGHPQYDDWAKETFGLFKRQKYVRQLSFILGIAWGIIEVAFKLYQILFDPAFNYDLWPLRYVMILVFTPLILYSPFMESKFRSAFSMGEEHVMRVIDQEPSFSLDSPMTLASKPVVLAFRPEFLSKKKEPPSSSSS